MIHEEENFTSVTPSISHIPLAGNFPFLIHMSRFMVQWVLKENTLEVLRKTALSLVKARREEGKLTKVRTHTY